MRLLNWAAMAAVLGFAGSAQAQDAVVEGPGVQVSEGTVLHPSVGMEAGYISNVFYEEVNANPSPLLRLLAKFAFASASGERNEGLTADVESSQGEPESLDFRAGLNFIYSEFLSGNEAVRAQRDVAIGADLHLGILPKGNFAFAIDDDFVRSTRPTNFESSRDLDRDVNTLRLGAKYQPIGRSISTGLRFENTIDVFESSGANFANRMKNTFGARVDWQFLPITRFYLDASYGFIGGLGDAASAYKQGSTPLRGRLGADTAITETTTIRASAGYGIGFYSAGADYSGLLATLELGWRYSPFGRVTLGYDKTFEDSINSNFYSEHAFKLTVDQQIDKVSVSAKGTGRLRSYQGISPVVGGGPVRDDGILSLELAASYIVRDWFAVTLNGSTNIVETDYVSMNSGVTDDPSYIRHQILAGVSAAF